MDNMRQQESHQEQTSRDMFFYLLSKWRILLLLMIIFGLLIGGYKFYDIIVSEYNPQKVVDNYEAAAVKGNSNNSNSSSNLDRLRSISDRLVELDQYRDQATEVNTDSVVKEWNWTEAEEINDMYSVSLDNSDDYSKTYIIADAIVSQLNSDSFYSKLADQLNIDASDAKALFVAWYYIPQYVSSSNASTGASIDAMEQSSEGDAEGNIPVNTSRIALYINAIGPDQEFCEKVLETAKTELDSISKDLSKSVNATSVTFIRRQNSSGMKDAVRDLVTSDTTAKDTDFYNGSVDALYRGLSEDEKDYVYALTTLKEYDLGLKVKEKKPIGYYIPKKFTLLGICVGLLLGVFIYMLQYLLSRKMYNAFEFQDNYGIRTYLWKDGKKSLKGLDLKIFTRRYESTKVFSADEVGKVIIAEVRRIAAEKKINKILITGSMLKDSMDAVDRISAALKESGIEVVSGQEVMYSPELIDASTEINTAFIVETLGESTKWDAYKEVEYLSSHGTEIAGAIVAV